MSLRFAPRRPSASWRSFLCFLCAATPRFTRDISFRPLEVRQQLAHLLEVGPVDEALACVATLALRRFVRVQVALEGLGPGDLARSGLLESLLRAAVTLQLGHSDTDSFDFVGNLVYGFPRGRTSRSRARSCRRRCGRSRSLGCRRLRTN